LVNPTGFFYWNETKTGDAPQGDEVKAELLFIAAFDRVGATQATYEFLLDKAAAFAEAFDGEESDPRFPIYSRLFCLRFRPGFSVTPEELLAEATALAGPAVAKLQECVEKSPKRLNRESEVAAEVEARKQAAIAARESYAARKAAEAEAAKQAEENAQELLQPATLKAVLITDLGIHGSAERAYKNAGLETVGDILTYAEAKPLPTINGISENFAKQTLTAIETKRSQFDKADTTTTE
jgi:hypothetical protein